MAGQSAVDEIREVLRREIVNEYETGDFLPTERDLAERFGVSRNTIRETIIHLEAFQLVRKTKRGPQVTKPDFETMFRGFSQFFAASSRTFVDVLNFRRIIETGAVPLIVHNATDDDIAALDVANRAMRKALTTSESAEQDYRFHLALIDAARNDVLSRMYRVMSEPLRFYLEVGKSQTPATNAASDHHEAIIAALGRRDPEDMADVLGAHFQHSADTLAVWLAESGGADAPSEIWPSEKAT
ncbi:FCD domain-containing protein [Phaeobacter sp. J2-8]|uniref:FadR/GntR family transcriptional regulator n=1 Tax=Phaeobacter sp. J2-8 TaxID=2931394 RepID=UPI001FD37DFE|nr:FCD domain-containing protein [Phaeobacter sp. J2-8]MCJ7874161.1 FCD domain-containing protein [Phaeobacter sp. J2-8]